MSDISRRRFVQGAAAASAIGLAGPAEAAPSKLTDIDHIIILMKENRSFDHYFGTMRGVRGYDEGGAVFRQAGPQHPDGYVLPFHLDTAATSAQRLHVLDHTWDIQHMAWNGGRMDRWIDAHRLADLDYGPLTMGYMTRADLPYYYALADAFTICDGYFSSLMGPTHPNRYYLMTGTNDPNGLGGGPAINNQGKAYSWETYPERLEARGISWRVYHDTDDYNCNVCKYFTQYQTAPKTSPLYDNAMRDRPFSALLADLRDGNIPQVTWIVPPAALSEHPAYMPAAGEAHTAQILDALWSNPALWAKTALILNYDENDGQFDHVAPPTPPPGTPDEYVRGLPVGLGFRVPCIVISPFSRGGYVCGRVFDHTSTLKLIEARFGVEVGNLSRWRRETVGDLTAAFGFDAPPDLSIPAMPDAQQALPLAASRAAVLPAPSVPLQQSLPRQEPGEQAAPRVTDTLPPRFARWFAARGWTPHRHQLDMLRAAREGRSTLLTAPTGGGKTLAGFLPSLVQLSEQPSDGLHTLYISPLKALAVDIRRNLERPIAELDLPIRAETRTGDTPASKRQRQREHPPQILMTTPESLALLLSYADAGAMFAGLSAVIVDELHALIGTKRGDLLALGLSRLTRLAPKARRVGLSATASWPEELQAYLGREVERIEAMAGPEPEISILATEGYLPWTGHMAMHAIPGIYDAIQAHQTTLVFVNTRAQAELAFQALWRLNDDNLPIGLHHGSLAVEQRRRIEKAVADGKLRAVVATSSLDLGIDWGAVDLVIQLGAPKGVSRLIQRIGRANHRLDKPSRAILAPANRFEFLECRAALEATYAHALDGDPPRPGGLDVLAQHILGMSCAAPFEADDLYAEITGAAPYARLSRQDFDDVLAFVEHGGYALRTYERWRRLFRDSLGRYRVAGERTARRYRMNIGTIVESPLLKVRLGHGPVLGEFEEYFAQGLVRGDTFIFAGQRLRFEMIKDMEVIASRAKGDEPPKVPAYAGGRLPLSTYLADGVRAILSDDRNWDAFPEAVREWLRLQEWRSVLPSRDGLLVESFPRNGREYLVAYPFEGRNAHQTLGMLLTRRMERAGYAPLGFVATDYLLAIWSLQPARDLDTLFDEDMLGDDLEAWMAESSLLRRTFRNVAVIAGLIEKKQPGAEKTRKQVTISSDLIYDVLRRHEPDHVLLRATRADAATGLTDVRRLGAMLSRVKGRIAHRRLDRVSPLAVAAILDIGREQVYGSALDQLLDEAAEEVVREATAGAPAEITGTPNKPPHAVVPAKAGTH